MCQMGAVSRYILFSIKFISSEGAEWQLIQQDLVAPE